MRPASCGSSRGDVCVDDETNRLLKSLGYGDVGLDELRDGSQHRPAVRDLINLSSERRDRRYGANPRPASATLTTLQGFRFGEPTSPSHSPADTSSRTSRRSAARTWASAECAALGLDVPSRTNTPCLSHVSGTTTPLSADESRFLESCGYSFASSVAGRGRTVASSSASGFTLTSPHGRRRPPWCRSSGEDDSGSEHCPSDATFSPRPPSRTPLSPGAWSALSDLSDVASDTSKSGIAGASDSGMLAPSPPPRNRPGRNRAGLGRSLQVQKRANGFQARMRQALTHATGQVGESELGSDDLSSEREAADPFFRSNPQHRVSSDARDFTGGAERSELASMLPMLMPTRTENSSRMSLLTSDLSMQVSDPSSGTMPSSAPMLGATERNSSYTSLLNDLCGCG